ncbi:MAG: hypothetical protein Q8O33_07280 [Pseudomonadota bacterium]|nr:hypothetical protein [Pseudomonadota bacterium]
MNTTSNWNDFNDADAQQGGFDLIPKATLVRVRMTIKPGGHDDPAQGWTGGYATESFESGSVYLACEFIVLEGPYVKRKLWSNIGLHSRKGPTWGQMGRSLIRAILNSARGIQPQDNSPQATAARRIQGFQELDGIEFLARVDVEKDAKGEDRNVVKLAIEPDHKDYAAIMGMAPRAAASASYPAPAPQAALRPAPSGKPAWAQ